MSYYFNKIPVLGAGLAWCVLNQLLTQVKSHRGLTTFIEHRGINGRWLKPSVPFNIRFTTLVKILELKARYQTDDEFLTEWNDIGKVFLDLVRTIDYAHKLHDDKDI